MKYGIINGELSEYKDGKTYDAVVETVKYQKGEIPKLSDSKKQALLNNTFTKTYSRFESYGNYDVVCLNLVNIEKQSSQNTPVYVILEKNSISFYTTEPEHIDALLRKIMHESLQNITADCLLYHFDLLIVFAAFQPLSFVNRSATSSISNSP